jgi:N6-L-threonylcarbamoyladenine synthase
MSLYLGIDTSAYTTSLALVDEKGDLLADRRLVLPVKQGDRGLRQSEALFEHVKNLPGLFAQLAPDLNVNDLAAVSVSAFPRHVPGSYMPVFLAGLSQARCLSVLHRIPCYEVSHQEGHIMAGAYGNEQLLKRSSFLAVHFSGGTSELLKVTTSHTSLFDIDLRLAGSDLHAGQLVDRVGVAMGLSFPAGRSLEEMARKASRTDITIPSSVNAGGFSFSGAETKALSLIKQGCPPEQIALAVLKMIANTLEKILLSESEDSGTKDVLLVGGVMANGIIRERLCKRLEHPAVGIKLYFAEPTLSTDNAVGTALLGRFMAEREFNADCADQDRNYAGIQH